MLANGITLGYATTKEGPYQLLDSLKSVPDLGLEPELVENTQLNAKNMQYDLGIGDAGELEYTFKYKDNKQDSETRKLFKICDDKTPVWWEQTYPDGTKFQFEATASYKLTGGAINDPVELTITLGVSSDLTRIDPEGV